MAPASGRPTNGRPTGLAVCLAALAAACATTETTQMPASSATLREADCYATKSFPAAPPASVIAVCDKAAARPGATVAQYAAASYRIGEAQLAMKSYPEAVKSLTLASDLMERSKGVLLPSALHALARGHVAQRAFDSAIAELARVIELQPGNVAARFDLADAQAQLGATQRAMDSYRAVIALAAGAGKDPKLASRAGVRLGGLVLQSPGPDGARRALDIYQAARDADPLNAEAFLGLGLASLRLATAEGAAAGNTYFTEALRAYDGAVALAQNSADAHAGRARALQGVGRLADAIEGYRRAAQLAPDQPARFMELARAEVSASRLPDAEASYTQALRLEQTAATWFELADVQLARNDLPKARLSLEAAQKLDPTFPGAYLGLGKLLYREGVPHYGAARDQLREAERLTRLAGDTGMRAEAAYYLSRIETEGGADRKSAIEYADVATMLDGRNAAYRDQACLSRIRFLNKDTARAQDAGAACAGGANPDAGASRLLKGMFELRTAQFMRGDDKKRRWEAAYMAFTSGLSAVDSTEPAADRLFLRRRLEVGQGLALYCVGFADIGRQAVGQADKDARAYFDTYHVAQCADY